MTSLPFLAAIATFTRVSRYSDSRSSSSSSPGGRSGLARRRTGRRARAGARAAELAGQVVALADSVLDVAHRQRLLRPPAWPGPPGTPGRVFRAGRGRGRPTAAPRPRGAGSPGGSWNSRRVFVTADRLLPTRAATSSWVRRKSSMSCWYAAASSNALRSWRCRFSTSACSRLETSLDGSHDGRDGLEAGPLGGPPPALAGDQLVAAIRLGRTHQDRLQHPELAHDWPSARPGPPRRSDDGAGSGWH